MIFMTEDRSAHVLPDGRFCDVIPVQNSYRALDILLWSHWNMLNLEHVRALCMQ